MMTFGQFFKQKRLALGKTLRGFCRENNLDPGNISKIERGKLPPPQGRLDRYAHYLRLDSNELETFKELGNISAGRFPEYITEENKLAALPIFFRALRDAEISKEKLEELAEIIKES